MSNGSISARVSRELSEEDRKHLVIASLPDGRVLGKCRSCPKNTRDIRGDKGGSLSAKGERNFAVSSAYSAPSVELAEAWFDAHRRSDFHAYYLAPVMREATGERRMLAQLFNEQPPPREVVPFPHARRGRGAR